MRRTALLFAANLVLSTFCWSQATPAAKPAPKPAPRPAAAGPTAIIQTTAGNLTCVLFPKVAPIGVTNFIGLAKGTKDWTSPVTHQKKHGEPLYNGTIFHRVIPEFMIQGGDPAGTGAGDPGYAFKNETSPSVLFDRPGRLAYANAGPDTNGSQFFITEVPVSQLNGGYTIFGQCDDVSVELVKKIARMPRNANDFPNHPVKIIHIRIVAAPSVRRAVAKPAVAKPTPKKMDQ